MPLRTLFTPPLPVVHLIKCAGVDILSTYIGGAYQSLSGTSMVCINLPMNVYACVCACADVCLGEAAEGQPAHSVFRAERLWYGCSF
jgi:hypothetical protein